MIRGMYPILIMLMVVTAKADALTRTPWHGFYVGGNAGAVWSQLNNQLTITNTPDRALFYQPVLAGVNASGSKTLSNLRVGGGMQVGYNQDIANNLLLGLEVSYDYLGLTTSSSERLLYTNSPTLHAYSLTHSASAKQMGTLHPRLGYHVGHYLPYVTAGGAVTGLQFKQTFTDHQYAMAHTNQLNQTVWGWVVGAGLEYRPEKHVSFKMEYLYANFGQTHMSSQFMGTGLLTGLSANVANTLHNMVLQTLLLGVNFHFA